MLDFSAVARIQSNTDYLVYQVSVFGKLTVVADKSNFISLTSAGVQIAMGNAHEHRSDGGTNESRGALHF